MSKITNFFKRPHKLTQIIIFLNNHGFCFLFPDKFYIKLMFRYYLNKKINLKNPSSFNEKLNWLKLYGENDLYANYVDKYEAKRTMGLLIGNEHIIRTYGVWDKFQDIDFNLLPNSFVLKCTHDSGSVVICKDKNAFDYNKAKKLLSRGLKRNYYQVSRERQYKSVKPRIIAEEFLVDNSEPKLIDYKFYCFNGTPKFLYVSQGLDNHATANISFLNLDWSFANFKRKDYSSFEKLPPKPKTYNKMLSICETIAKRFPFVRVDLYEVNGQVYFSELTFTPTSGYMPFMNEDDDYVIGSMLNLKGK